MSRLGYVKPEEVYCEECGSTEVTAMGEMTWNPKWNQWEPTGEISYYYCNGECGGETQIKHREVPQ